MEWRSANEALATGISEEGLILYRLFCIPAFKGVIRYSRRRRFFLTKRGCMGLGPNTARPGDLAVMINSLDDPMILRPTGNVNEFHLIGPTLVSFLPKEIDAYVT
ncbi:hypothetical protein BDZ45DRAFT_680404 [Acephala macrosclerotiorum]|nr:hypothetical protein BDZ45DRAFT_680404 [Acephala macrosclerotiorum]